MIIKIRMCTLKKQSKINLKSNSKIAILTGAHTVSSKTKTKANPCSANHNRCLINLMDKY